MKKWFKRRKERAAGDAPPGARRAGAPAGGAPGGAAPHGASQLPRSDSGSDYTDDGDEPVHDFEIAQEDYLVSVALATSANEYQRNGGGAGGSFPLGGGAAAALELSEKYWATCRCASARPGRARGGRAGPLGAHLGGRARPAAPRSLGCICLRRG